LFISLACLELYFRIYFIREELLYTIILIIIFDVTSYVLGTKFGKLKILPVISPNKTYYGLISGILVTFILGILLNYFYRLFEFDLMIFFIIFTLISAFIGDITESYFKRKCNLINSSNLLPGHGGFFDRFDSLIMVVIWLFFFNLII
jgi:phosphatidate cytidylyltransferase